MLFIVTIFIFLIYSFNFSIAADLPPEAEKGEALFLQKCASCHTVGKGKLVGPDLKGVTTRRDESWLRSFIKDPQKLFDKKDQIALELLREYNNIQMPASGLKDSEISLIIEYLGSQTGGTGSSASVESRVVSQRNKEMGMALFTGNVRFKNGGSACISCHTIAGINILGGSLGPDLTGAGETYSREGLASVLMDIPFPTMQPVYSAMPLTDEEVGNLAEFIAGANASGSAKSFKDSMFLIVAGLILCVVVIQTAWGARLKNVRRTLINKAISKEVS